MTLLRNLALFFVLFLPVSCATGIVGGFFVGPIEAPRLAYPVLHYAVGVLPLLLPSLLAVPVLHFALRYWARDPRHNADARLTIGMTPLVLLGVHLAIFGFAYWSVPLLVLFLLPGAIYGASFRVVRPRRGAV